MSLQYGVPLEVYVNKFSHTRFEPMGATKNPDIRIAKSIVDYIFRWLGITFLNRPSDAGTDTGIPYEGTILQTPKVTPQLPTAQEEVEVKTTVVTEESAQTMETAVQPEPAPVSEPVPAPKADPEPALASASASLKKTATASSAAVREAFPQNLESSAARKASRFEEQVRAFYARRSGTVKKTAKEGGNSATSILDEPMVDLSSERMKMFENFQDDAPLCSNCGSVMVRNGSCYLCHVCGSTSGCS